jgi:hypothetical protein
MQTIPFGCSMLRKPQGGGAWGGVFFDSQSAERGAFPSVATAPSHREEELQHEAGTHNYNLQLRKGVCTAPSPP